jgi:hypothetical protein
MQMLSIFTWLGLTVSLAYGNNKGAQSALQSEQAKLVQLFKPMAQKVPVDAPYNAATMQTIAVDLLDILYPVHPITQHVYTALDQNAHQALSTFLSHIDLVARPPLIPPLSCRRRQKS